MKTRPDHRQANANRERNRAIRRYGLLALAAGTLLLSSCGGGGNSTPPPPNVPLVWDQAQATWDNVNWQ